MSKRFQHFTLISIMPAALLASAGGCQPEVELKAELESVYLSILGDPVYGAAL